MRGTTIKKNGGVSLALYARNTNSALMALIGQPPHDISHLNRRRQRTREKQNIELTKDFKSKSRADHEARKGPSQVTT